MNPFAHHAARAAVKALATMAVVGLIVAVSAQAQVVSAATPATAASTAAARAAVATALAARYDAANREYELRHHAAAFAAFAALADEGHCDAARLAQHMIYAGPAAYGQSFRAGPKQLARWRNMQRCGPAVVVVR